MSTSMISSHIPDLDFITNCAERQKSVFARISPWTKFILLVLVIMMITISGNILFLAMLYATILLACFIAGLPIRTIVAWYALPAVFVISLVGILVWTQPGIPLLTIPFGTFDLTLTDQGLLLVITLLLKTLISVTFSLFFLMTTKYAHFSAMISRFFPAPLDQIFLLAYRFLFLTLAMAGSLLKSVRSRGGGIFRSILVQGRLFAGVFGLVFIRSFERAERVEKAMIARGYNGTSTAHTTIRKPGNAECGFLLCATGFTILLALQPSLFLGG
jgi:cobalt/nickel transport system permease protein